MEAFKEGRKIKPLLVHTGQHYDEKMSDLFFRQLGIPEPEINLGVSGGSHAVQTAEIMRLIELVLLEHRPDALLVVGDVNSTIACGLVATKLGIKLIHVEAGLRSFDRSMPEEVNRILTDSISDLLFCTEESGRTNLLKEGHDPADIFLVGNLMIDSLLKHKEEADALPVLHEMGLKAGNYAVMTLHRPANVDTRESMESFLTVIEHVQKQLPIVFPVHPRTRKNLSAFGLEERVRSMPGLVLTEPLGYLEFLKLISSAKVVLTDSGGIQEETTILGVPCLTLRENTERPVTCQLGTNRLVGTTPANVIQAFNDVLAHPPGPGKIPPRWDGKTARRIVDILESKF